MIGPNSIQTRSGAWIDIFNPDPDEILIEDMAHSLALECRFGNHIKRLWSSAQHGLLVSALCAAPFKLAGLMHDGSDYVFRDIPRPIKRHPSMSLFLEAETAFQRVIERKFDAHSAIRPEVKSADEIALWAEAEIFHHGTRHWPTDRIDDAFSDRVSFAKTLILDMVDLDAKTLFLKQFTVLTGGDVHA